MTVLRTTPLAGWLLDRLPRTRLTLMAGACRVVSVVVRGADRLPVDLSGCSVALELAVRPGNMAVSTIAGAVTDAAGGVFTVPILPDDLTLFADGTYWHQAVVTDAAGDRAVVLCGQLILEGGFGEPDPFATDPLVLTNDAGDPFTGDDDQRFTLG
jgi:hypothetical protein